MRLSTVAATAGICAGAHAFSDSSPFIIFSSVKLSSPKSEAQLQSSTSILESTKQILSSCPTDRYILVSQPNLNAAHLSSQNAVPRLRESLDSASSSYTVSEVAGDIDLKSIISYIKETCGTPNYAIDEVNLAPLPSGSAEREKVLEENDIYWDSVLSHQRSSGDSLTVIYTGGPRTETPQTYTAEFPDHGVGELRRRDDGAIKRKESKERDTRPLFEKYQFFTPGIFMALIALIILMSVLYAGISAVASLQVSYGAFDKEMGPSAQKKQN
ncbi:BIG1-domain-containing protein [Xylariaceae sp. FL1019]|nr:BIG1-domain-containing protein [Xylariaceae sp. FL1019]